ncbi:MAG: HAD family hydrolase [Phycisphaerae bacterium]
MTLHAVFFDFDGVIVDSEPLHFEGFRRILKTIGVELTRKAYYSDYLGYDDHDCFTTVVADQGRRISPDQLRQLIEAKTQWMQKALAEQIEPLPGAVELIRQVTEAGVPTAICSGALRQEIIVAARKVGVLECFPRVIAAEDVREGKPAPEGYVLAKAAAEETSGRTLARQRCVVIEDSPAGIAAGKAAGMKVLAVATSYDPADLEQADRILDRLTAVGLGDLESLVQ